MEPRPVRTAARQPRPTSSPNCTVRLRHNAVSSAFALPCPIWTTATCPCTSTLIIPAGSVPIQTLPRPPATCPSAPSQPVPGHSHDAPDPGSLPRVASPSAICLAEHLVEFGVGPELPYLLRTAAGDRDLCGPLEGSLPCGHVDDGEAATEILGLRVRAVGDRPVGGHDARPLEIQSTGEEVHACVQGLLGHRVCGLGHRGHVLAGDVVHRAVIERDQVLRHPMTPLS